MDDVTTRVYEFAKGCLEELYKQKEYIALLESYIEDLENGVEVPSAEPIQLEQPLEMENTNDDMDDRRPRAVRKRNAGADQSTSGRECEAQHESDDSDGGSGSSASSADNLDK